MRRSAGAYARGRRIELLLLLVLAGGLVAGLGIGQALPAVVGFWFDGWRRTAAVSCVTLFVLGLLWGTCRSIERTRFARLEKGEDAETYAGQVIE